MAISLKIKGRTKTSYETIGLPICPQSFFGETDCQIRIEWGDGEEDHYSGTKTSAWAATHEYESAGMHTITVHGGYGATNDGNYDGGKLAFPQNSFSTNGVASAGGGATTQATPKKFYSIKNVDGFYVHGQGDFYDFKQLRSSWCLRKINILKSSNPESAISLVSTGGTFLLNHTFYNCKHFKSVKSNGTKLSILNSPKTGTVLGKWDVSSCTSMQGTFQNSGFNGKIGNWDVTSVESMKDMFNNAKSFAGHRIFRWFDKDKKRGGGVSDPARSFAIENIDGMFKDASSFNVGIAKWDTSTVTSAENVFTGATSFSKSVDQWDTSSWVIDSDYKGFGLQGRKGPNISSRVSLPSTITVSLTSEGNTWFPNDGPGPAGNYSINDPADLSDGEGYGVEFNSTSWPVSGNNNATIRPELMNKELYYYAQTSRANGIEGPTYYIVVHIKRNEFYLLPSGGGWNLYDQSPSLLEWSGNQDLISVS